MPVWSSNNTHSDICLLFQERLYQIRNGLFRYRSCDDGDAGNIFFLHEDHQLFDISDTTSPRRTQFSSGGCVGGVVPRQRFTVVSLLIHHTQTRTKILGLFSREGFMTEVVARSKFKKKI
jgi:hypothetical protein